MNPLSVCCLMLKLATGAYLTGAGADAITTYQTFDNPVYVSAGFTETNVMYRSLAANHPRVLFPVMVANDFAIAWAVNKWVSPKHPKLAVVGLFIAAGVRGWVAGRNVERMRETDRRVQVPQFVRYY